MNIPISLPPQSFTVPVHGLTPLQNDDPQQILLGEACCFAGDGRVKKASASTPGLTRKHIVFLSPFGLTQPGILPAGSVGFFQRDGFADVTDPLAPGAPYFLGTSDGTIVPNQPPPFPAATIELGVACGTRVLSLS